MQPTRAQRNNNPGNIDRNQVPWLGEDRSAAALGSEARFCVFVSPEMGYRALAKVLQSYQDRYGLHTVRTMVNRWAPPVENDTGAYVTDVANTIGVGPDDQIDVANYRVLFGLVKAIAHHESGFDPWPDAIVQKGLALVGSHP